MSAAFWGAHTTTAALWGPSTDEANPVHSGASALQQSRLATYEDVYAFGAIMVEIVTGVQSPHQALHLMSFAVRVLFLHLLLPWVSAVPGYMSPLCPANPL